MEIIEINYRQPKSKVSLGTSLLIESTIMDILDGNTLAWEQYQQWRRENAKRSTEGKGWVEWKYQRENK